MRCYYDLHIHSALSPCGDEDMTPNNIVNMAKLVGLDLIALTDHNTGGNLAATAAVARKADLLFLPGIEIETAEEIHMVCYFPDLPRALEAAEVVGRAMPPIANRPDIFGRQLFLDEQDEIVGQEERMLITACSLSLEKTVELVRSLGGAAIPAHVDKPANSIIASLGYIPPEFGFTTLEVSTQANLEKITYPYQIIQSSDAHYLHQIMDRKNKIEICGYCIKDVINFLLKTGDEI